MELRPIFYLSSWETGDLSELQRIAQIGIPVLLLAEDIQTSPEPEKVLEIFSSKQLQIISNEVEDLKDPLQLVIEHCAQKGWTHIISINQFSSEIINSLLGVTEEIKKDPWQFINFVPKEQSENKNHAFVQRLLDLGETDYRTFKSELCVYPVFYVQDLKFKKNNPLKHLKILVHAFKKQRSVRKIALDIEIKKKELTLSNRLRASCYDWWLLALTSLHQNNRPIHSALSLAMGVFLACTPFYGLQTLLIIGAALLFRLSFPVAFLGSQVSLPPIYSLLVPLQLYIGFYITGKKFEIDGPWLEMAQTHFTAWAIGSVIVGSLLALVLGFAWYCLQKKGQKKQATWTGGMRGGRFGNFLMVSLMKLLGLRFAYFLLFFIVPYFYLFSPAARRGLNEYYQITQPERGYCSRQWATLKHLYRFAQTIVDQAYQAFSKELFFEIKHLSEDVLKEQKVESARVMLFSHFGGWGMTTQGFSRRNLEKPVHLLRYETQALSSDRVINEKNKNNLKCISVKPGEPAFMAIHQVLRAGEHLAVMGDRPFDNSFQLSPFLGRLAPIPTTPFRLAKTYKARLSFVLGFKTGFKTYGLVTKTIDMSESSVDEAIKIYLKFLESYIAQYPEQWFNHYNYWSSLPTLPNGQQCIPKKYTLSVDA